MTNAGSDELTSMSAGYSPSEALRLQVKSLLDLQCNCISDENTGWLFCG